MTKIFMIGFTYRHESYVANVFCQERGAHATYHLKMVNHFPHLFTGTLIIEKNGDQYKVHSPSTFSNDELFNALTTSLRQQELAI